MNVCKETSFKVSRVWRAAEPLTEVPYLQGIEAQLTPGVTGRERRWVEDRAKQGYSVAEVVPLRPVEACTHRHGRLLDDVAFHPVVAAAHLAFMDHRPLRLSPDAIWLMICQGVANHVTSHAEELRPRLVSHEGTVEIHIRRDDFVKGSPGNPWPEVIDEFSARVREHVGPAIDLFLPAFSTSGPAERAAAGVVLMDAVQSFFQYSTGSLCGIPEITLEGTTADWEALAHRAEEFAEFGLEVWLDILRPILRQFVRASQGDVDRVFWKSLYKQEDMSGAPLITGWIVAFFPYAKDHQSGRASHPVPWFFVEDRRPLELTLYPVKGRDRSGGFYGPNTSMLPGGLSSVPFRWDYLDRAIPMEFLGGFVGVAQNEKTLALRPEIGWAVRQASA